jgi:hypothetical protein
VVTLSMWGAHGPLSVPGTQGIVIAPHRWVTRSIADLAPDVPAVAVHVHADSGSVSAAIHDVASQGVSPAGGDWIPPTLGPARSMVVPGILRIGGRKTLVLANPGDRDAAASLRLVTTNGAFAPAGSQSVVVPAGHTSAVDLTTAIAGEASAVLVTSDQPLFGEVQNVASLPQKYNEFAWLPAQPPVRAPVGVATTTAPFGQLSRLVVTAPLGGGQLRLSVPGGRSQTVAVPGGRTSTFDLAAMFPAAPSDPRPILVEPIGANPLYLARTLLVFGAHGPLMSSLPPAAFAQPVPLPAVLPDLRVATR